MGYGGVSSSGEFTDVRLERLEESVIIITNDAIQTEKRQNDTNITNKYANIEYQSKENQLRQDNGRNCSIKEAVKLSRIADGLWPSPIYEDIQPLANPPSLFEQPFRTQDMSRVVAMRDAGSLPELRVVLFGDSIVAIGAQEGFGWHEQFRKLVDSTLKSMPSTTRVKLIDASVGGDCTRQMAERLYANVIAYRPHLVIIHVAKTEAWYYHTYFTRLRWIVRTIQQLTDAHVVLWTPTPFLPEIDQTYHDLPHYNSVLQIGNETGCSVVDMRYAFLNNELPLKELLWNDGKHPSRQGQELIARTLGTYCGAALSLTNSVARWSQQSVKAVSDQWQVHDPVKGAADYLGRTGGKLDCLFTGTWVVATFGTVECSNFAFYIDGVQPLYSNQMVMFATTPLPHTNNVNTGEHPFGNKTDFCRPLRIFAGTNAVPEKWTMRFVTPDTFSVSGSVTGFDGILTNASDVVFSTSGRVAVRPSDVWWAGIRMYNPGDIFEFHMVPIAKNDYSAYRLDASGTIAAHLPHGLHILSIGVPATPQNCRVTVTGIDSGSENIDSELVQSTPLTVSSKSALLLNNGAFRDGLKGWQYWSDACQQTNSIALVPVQGMPGVRQALRIMNPHKKLVGVQQTVHLESNAVYRLSGIVRSLATKASEILFGGRVALWLPPQPEQQIVWMSEYNNWLHKELVFTNQVSGTAVVYVHLGYGNVATTGEFTDVRLEKVER
ncbi:MAG: GDSL-type esterase/lipase family protein [bacterium]|nr:GDSL-type esterase/lipase family protein [bacterium]